MDGLTTRSEPTISGSILVSNQWSPTEIPFPFPAVSTESDFLLQIVVPEFDLVLAGPVMDIDAASDYSEVTVRSFIDSSVSAEVTLRNEPVQDLLSPLQIKDISLKLIVVGHASRAYFFSESLYAMLGLAGKISLSIPQIGFDVGVNFAMSPSEISKMMQRRQIYFGLLVIERATRLNYEIPSYIPGEDIDAISFSYHAIGARQFRWLCNDVTLMMPATEESVNWLQELAPTELGGSIYKVSFGPTPKSRSIFGRMVSLGNETVYLDDAVIQDREQILDRIARRDGEVVPVKFRPLSRKARYVFDNAPRLPASPWDEKITALIGLEGALDVRLAARYHNLATSDLTPDEINAVRERPDLGEDAHLID